MTAPNTMPLSGVIDLTMSDDELSVVRRRNLCSSIRRLCKLSGVRPEDAPAALPWLRRQFKGLHPVQVRLSVKRLRNIRSDVAFGIKRYAVNGDQFARRAALTPQWAALWARLPEGPRYRLSRFLRFLSLYGYERVDVSDALIDEFRRWLEDFTTAVDPEKVVRQSIRTWNRAVGEVSGWSQLRLREYWRTERFTPDWDELPASLKVEAEAWLESLRNPDILDENAPARPLSEATIRSRRYQVQQILGALLQRGFRLDDFHSLADLVELDRIRVVYRFFLDRNGGAPSTNIAGIACAAFQLAKHWVRVDPEDLVILKELRRRVTPRHNGISERNQVALVQFDVDRNKRLFVNLPVNVLREVRRKKELRQEDALAIQMALAVAIEHCLPIRLKNLAGLDPERHFIRHRCDGQDRILIQIPSAEVKNGEPLSFYLSEWTMELLAYYRDQCRHLLTKKPSTWLFPGKVPGQHKSPTQLSRGITSFIRRRTGLAVTVHQFRHIAAKLILDDDPSQFETVRRVLGHKRLETTTKAYAGLDAKVASQVLARTLEKYRKGEGIEDG